MIDDRYEGIKYNSGKFESTRDHIVPERSLQIKINGEQFSVTMCSPGQEVELALGLLYCEGVFQKNMAISYDLEISQKENTGLINMLLPTDALLHTNKRSLLSVASCGICGVKELEVPKGKVDSQSQIDPKILKDLFSEMQNNQDAFVKTGGSHGAAIFDKKKKIVAFSEDVGRHNAVDKSIGQLLLKNQLNESEIMLVSGRISYEIIVKCFKSKIPILAAVSSPSSLSIDFAKELGVTLIGFCRDDKFTVYSHPQRIKGIHVPN